MDLIQTGLEMWFPGLIEHTGSFALSLWILGFKAKLGEISGSWSHGFYGSEMSPFFFFSFSTTRSAVINDFYRLNICVTIELLLYQDSN